MLDIGWPEFTIILIIALLVIGPKDLPKALNAVGKWVRKARMITREFQRHVDDMVKDSELEELRELRKLNKHALAGKLRSEIDPTGAMDKALNTRDIGKPGEAGGVDKAAADETDLPTGPSLTKDKPVTVDPDTIRQAKLATADRAATAPAPGKPAAAPEGDRSGAQPQKRSTEMSQEELADWRARYREARSNAARNIAPRSLPPVERTDAKEDAADPPRTHQV